MNNLTKEELNIVTKLKKEFLINKPPEISQERLNLIIDNLIEKNDKEQLWRLSGTYSEFYERKYNYNKIIDYFIKIKDSYYLEELMSFIGEELDHKYITNEMIKTNDKIFIKNTLQECGNSAQYNLDPHELEKLLDFIKEKRN